jgi:hypothetical protein
MISVDPLLFVERGLDALAEELNLSAYVNDLGESMVGIFEKGFLVGFGRRFGRASEKVRLWLCCEGKGD